jgi:hypothetical protein
VISWKNISKNEQLYYEAILLEEVEIQAWFAVTYIQGLGEIFISIQ